MPVSPARIVNGRGGRAPGFDYLNIDIYPPLIFITLYSDYQDEEIEQISSLVKTIFRDNPILIQDRSIRPFKTRLKHGVLPDEMIIQEDGLKYYVNPLRGQNPGFFTDMRDGREWIRKCIEPGDHVLNLFAYTCALSVVSIAAGAAKVVNIDKNRRSLDIGKKNHSINNEQIPGGYRNKAVFLPHDIFKSIGKLKKEGPYHLIVADPPPSQKGSFLLSKDYPRLLRRLSEMLHPGGKLFLTHNGPGWSWEGFENMISENLPDFHVLERIQPPEDFAPIEDGHGLKIIITR
jgi:23S rRNA (cytosine1962-C5)-methyltransferase